MNHIEIFYFIFIFYSIFSPLAMRDFTRFGEKNGLMDCSSVIGWFLLSADSDSLDMT